MNRVKRSASALSAEPIAFDSKKGMPELGSIDRRRKFIKGLAISISLARFSTIQTNFIQYSSHTFIVSFSVSFI